MTTFTSTPHSAVAPVFKSRLRPVLLAAWVALLPPAALAQDSSLPLLKREEVRNVASELVYRASLGRADDIRLLLDMGASANQTNDDGVPVLSLAAARRDPEALPVAEALLARGANINGQDKAGQNALFYVVRSGRREMLEYLLNQNIDYYAANKDGMIARNMAYQNDKTEFVQLMDEFVLRQTEKVNKQYEERNRQIAAQQTKAQREAQEAADKAKREREEQQRLYLEKLNKQGGVDHQRVLGDLRFRACAFQYWSYVRDTAQKNELTADELSIAIDSNKQELLAAMTTLQDQFAMSAAAVEAESKASQQNIFAQLDGMLSKTERFQSGVGKMADMDKRCRAQVEEMKKAPPAKPAAPANAATAPLAPPPPPPPVR